MGCSASKHMEEMKAHDILQGVREVSDKKLISGKTVEEYDGIIPPPPSTPAPTSTSMRPDLTPEQQKKKDSDDKDLEGLWYMLEQLMFVDTPQRKAAFSKGKSIVDQILKIHEQSHVYNALEGAAKFCAHFGHYEMARDMYERDLKETIKYFGGGHENVVAVLINLAKTYGTLGDQQNRRLALERALLIQEKLFGVNHPNVAITLGLGNLANCYDELGELEMKQAALERTMNILPKIYGTLAHPSVAIHLTNLGMTHNALGFKYHDPVEFSLARDILERALKLDERVFQGPHPETAITLGALAVSYGELDQLEEKKDTLLKALAIEEEVHGSMHSTVPVTLTNLAIAYGQLGNHHKKRTLLERALHIQEKLYGKSSNPNTAVTLDNLGNACAELGDTQTALTYLQRALGECQFILAPIDPTLGIVYGNLGNVHGDLGQHEEARDCLERALKIKEEAFGIDSESVANTCASLAQTLERLGERKRARLMMDRAVTIMKAIAGSRHPSVLEWKEWLANEEYIYQRSLENAKPDGIGGNRSSLSKKHEEKPNLQRKDSLSSRNESSNNAYNRAKPTLPRKQTPPTHFRMPSHDEIEAAAVVLQRSESNGKHDHHPHHSNHHQHSQQRHTGTIMKTEEVRVNGKPLQIIEVGVAEPGHRTASRSVRISNS